MADASRSITSLTWPCFPASRTTGGSLALFDEIRLNDVRLASIHIPCVARMEPIPRQSRGEVSQPRSPKQPRVTCGHAVPVLLEVYRHAIWSYGGAYQLAELAGSHLDVRRSADVLCPDRGGPGEAPRAALRPRPRTPPVPALYARPSTHDTQERP